MSETYLQEVFCKNCDFSGPTDIPKGQMIEKTACPTCGNMTLEKLTKPMRLTPHIGNYE